MYDDAFYEEKMSGSYVSATLFLEYLFEFFLPRTVVDVGCGRGAWLKACKNLGVKALSGYDGQWNSQQAMVDSDIVFETRDLAQPLICREGRFDLAMSLEVAEHLDPSVAKTFIRSLTGLSDLVLFGAAFTGQGGLHHINEQPHSYWAKYFAENEYLPFDLFRPRFWGDQRVEFWYRQNTFLYVRRDSDSYAELISQGVTPLAHIEFMDCVHPELYHRTLRKQKADVGYYTAQVESLRRPGVKAAIQLLGEALRRKLLRSLH